MSTTTKRDPTRQDADETPDADLVSPGAQSHVGIARATVEASASLALAAREAAAQDRSSVPARVLVADDMAYIRRSLKLLLSCEPGIVLVGEAGNGAEAVAQAERLRPDVVLMDVAMPVMSGEDATRAILARFPQVVVIALSSQPADQFGPLMRAAGASGFVSKMDATTALVPAIWQSLGAARRVPA